MNIPYAFKKCSKCGEWKVANNYNFRKRKSCKWGLYSQCKKCEKEYSKQYYENNKEHLKGYSREYGKDNKEHYKEYGKQWRADNKKWSKEYGKQWREDNPEKCFNYKNERRSKLENQGRGIDKIQ